MLNDRQRLFCDEYIVDLNATAAAIRAGYSAKTATVTASKLMRKQEVIDCIETLKIKREVKTEFTAQEVLQKLSILARANISKFFKRSECGTGFVMEIPENATAEDFYGITEITTEVYTEGKGEDKQEVKRTRIKMESKLKALELAGKHVSVLAFDDSKNEKPIEIVIRDANDVVSGD